MPLVIMSLVARVATSFTLRSRNRTRCVRCESGKDAPSGRNRLLNFLIRVRDRHEAGLERGRGQVDAFREHAMKETLEAFDVAGHDVAEILDGLVGEEQAE